MLGTTNVKLGDVEVSTINEGQFVSDKERELRNKLIGFMKLVWTPTARSSALSGKVRLSRAVVRIGTTYS